VSWSIVTLCACGSKRLQSGCPFSALAFYTEVLGFTKRRDVPVGDNFWLTVVSPESPDGPELLLEPSDHPGVKPYRVALAEDGIPLAQFAVDDVEAEHARLTSNGVVFS
jgi:catechol 2,3-dioxygenase-like lactoylglutathione lyase family enzyme